MDFGLQRGWLPSDDLGHGPATYQLECCFQVEFRSSLEFQACPNDCDCDDGGGEGCIEAGMQDAGCRDTRRNVDRNAGTIDVDLCVLVCYVDITIILLR